MQNTVELYIGNKIYSGWQSIQIMRSLECMSGMFTLGLTAKVNDNGVQLEDGVSCYLNINGNRVITGYVDDIERQIDSENRTITASGRDKTADAIDCDAVRKQWKNATLQQIATDLCQPFGINVIWQADSVEALAPFRFWKTEPSETVFENIAKAARHRGVIVTSTVYGDLVFDAVGQRNVAVLELGKNIKSINILSSHKDRFSEYRVIGDSCAGGLWGETQTSAQSTRVKSIIRDEQVKRYRPKTIIADDNLTSKTAIERAMWEQRRALAHSKPVTITVKNWFNGDALWQPNTLVTVNAPTEGYSNTELLIVTVTFDLTNEGGTVTTLLLMPPEGFDEPAQKERNGGGLWQ